MHTTRSFLSLDLNWEIRVGLSDFRLDKRETGSRPSGEMNLSNYIEMRIPQAQLHRRCRWATSFDRTIGIDITIVFSLLRNFVINHYCKRV